MTAKQLSLSPANAASSLTLAAEVFTQWKAGRVVVLDNSGITVDGVALCGTALSPCVPPGGPINGSLTLAAENLPNIFQFDGKEWTFQFAGKRIVKKKQLGFYYIHTLLETPCISVNAKELVAVFNCHKFNCSKPEQVLEQNDDEGSTYTPSLASGESVPVDAAVDQTTLQQVRNNLNSLRAELESYRKSGDEVAAREAEEEIHELEKYLKENCHGTRSVSFNSGANKNRKSVRVAITRAIDSIAEDHPALALHLKNSTKTGFSCCYLPEKKTEWVL